MRAGWPPSDTNSPPSRYVRPFTGGVNRSARRSREPSEASRQTRPRVARRRMAAPTSAMYAAPSSIRTSRWSGTTGVARGSQARTVTSGHGGSARSRVGHKMPSPPAAASSVSATAPDSCARCAVRGKCRTMTCPMHRPANDIAALERPNNTAHGNIGYPSVPSATPAPRLSKLSASGIAV